ncbi:MAG: hypothetical protein M1812_002610 [Candelaria pacifica]|nr:MAG: hypothetical protein M1812_002610 [Candelaria pacifica]
MRNKQNDSFNVSKLSGVRPVRLWLIASPPPALSIAPTAATIFTDRARVTERDIEPMATSARGGMRMTELPTKGFGWVCWQDGSYGGIGDS